MCCGAGPSRSCRALTGLSEEAARRWYDNFRGYLPQETHVLEHIVQLDEAYFKNMVLMMAKEKGSRKLAYYVFSGTSAQRHHATHFLHQKIKPGSELWTDGAAIYRGIEKWWPVEHKRDIHSKFEFEHTSEIEGIFGNYRTFVRRMYHHHWSENLEEYVREFCFRFSSPEMFNSPHEYPERSLSHVPID